MDLKQIQRQEPVKKDRLNTTIDPELKEKLKQAARKERRSLSNYLEGVFEKWLEKGGG